MNIEEKYLTPNEYSRPQNKIKQVKGIVIHWVANPNSTAISNRNYFENLKNEKKYASAHFVIGIKGEIINCIPLDEIAYHVGASKYRTNKLGTTPNYYTIGIECCHLDWNGKMPEETYNSLIELTDYLCDKFNLNPLGDCYRHYDVTGKLCHRFFVDNIDEWESFKEKVKNYKKNIINSKIENIKTENIKTEVEIKTIDILENDKLKKINVLYKDDTNYVPIKFLENYGYDVLWNTNKKMVEIHKKI